MPLFNDRRSSGPAKPISPGTPTPTGPSVFSNNRYVGPPAAPTPKPAPLNVAQQTNVQLNNAISRNLRFYNPPADGGWQAKGIANLKSNINTYNTLMNKVGPNSPRYSEFVGAKQRATAGLMKLTQMPWKDTSGKPGRLPNTTTMRESDPEWAKSQDAIRTEQAKSGMQNRLDIMHLPTK